MPKQIGVNERGRRVGESHPRAKLSDADVDLLLECLEPNEHGPGLSLGQAAAKFGVTKSQVKRYADGVNRAQRPVRYRAVKR